MAEKPRLKETDEILNSIGKKRLEQPILPTDLILPPVEAAAPEPVPGSAPPRTRKRTSKKAAKKEAPAPTVELERRPLIEEEDKKPLNFSKYEIPGRRKKPSVPVAPKEDEEEDYAAPAEVEIVAPGLAQEPAEPEPPPSDIWPQPEPGWAPKGARTIISSPDAVKAEVVPFEFEDLNEARKRSQAEEEARIAAEQAAAAAREAREQARAELDERLREAAKAADDHRGAQARHRMLEDANYRENAFRQLSSQFEEEFIQQFERDKAKAPKEKPSWLGQREKPKLDIPLVLEPEAPPKPQKPPRRPAVRVSEQPRDRVVPMYTPPDFEAPKEDEEAARQADSFLERFEQGVLQEEEDRAQSFKETLAEKFLRERQRYLQELSEAASAEPDPPPEPVPAPAQRRLNIQIQPDMHLRQGEAPPVRPTGPVTYTRAAKAEPQIPVDFAEPEAHIVSGDLGGTAGGKKSAEQLVLELAAQNKRRGTAKPATEKKPSHFKFSFTSPDEENKTITPENTVSKKKRKELQPRSRSTIRVAALSAVTGVLVLSLAAWGVSTLLNRNPPVPAEAGEASTVAGEPQELLEAYQNYTASGQAQINNVVVKRSGITLGNLTVARSLVVEEEAAAQGVLTLSNVLVGDLIYIKTSGVNELELRDVKSTRLVINNEKHPVTVRVSGNTDIGTLESRTATVVEQGGLTGDSPGVCDVVVRNEDAATGALSFDAKGAAFQSLSAQGETVIGFDSASVDTMTADGNLALTGSGRVRNLSVGLGAVQGAGDTISANPLNVLIKGVEIGHLNVKSPANLNISSNVDSIAAADSVNLGGNGIVGSLVFNEKFGNGRLAVDVSGLNIQQLTTNTEATIYSNGSAVINTLTANQSTYALGNKVNLLIANSNGVIYENEPDAKRVASGVRPPESKADNPNLNYSLSTSENTLSTDVTGDPVATTCNHSRETGGFVRGNGSKQEPFVVETAAQLAHVSQHLASHFVQAQDIDIADDSSFAGGFPIIAGDGVRFSGVYDGGGYAIRNLRVLEAGEYAGLFAENTGVIRNIHIASGEIHGNTQSFAGGIAGFNYQSGQIDSCSNGAVIYAGDSAYAGGIAGYNYGGKVRDCYNTARVAGGDYTGGIVGMNRQGASVTGSYNVGMIEGSGVVGAVLGANEEATATNCYFLEGTAEQGIGEGGGNVVGVTTEEMSSAQMAADLAAGNDASLWQKSGSDSYVYPTLKKPPAQSASEE